MVDLQCLINVLWLVSTDWLSLEYFKKLNPVEVAEHASARKIDKEAAFNWYVPFALKNRKVIMSQVTSRIRKNTHKHRIEVPASLNDVAEIDSSNKNTFCTSQPQKYTSFRDV